MVAQEFLDIVKKFEWANYIGVEDFADRLNFSVSVGFLSLCIIIITLKQYFMTAIACYTATTPGGSDFEKYLENYCWVHGTITILPHQKIPQQASDWEKLDATNRINYYQWVPFILGLQCIMYYLPRLIWQIICYNRSGTDLEHLVRTAGDAVHSKREESDKIAEHIASNLHDMMFNSRDYRRGRIADFKRSIFRFSSFLIASKRMGTWLVLSYFFIKGLYLLNAVTQLYIMKKFLGFNASMFQFGYHVLSNIATGHEWEETGTFPRVSYCYMHVRHLGNTNKYTAQCALPVNMLNEKIYIFLWFWTCLVALTTLISIPFWFFRMYVSRFRTQFIKKFLRMASVPFDKESDKKSMSTFVDNFLRHDGVFILRMISVNAGDIITTDIVTKLWEKYIKTYKDYDFLNDRREGESEKIDLKLAGRGNALKDNGDKNGTLPAKIQFAKI